LRRRGPLLAAPPSPGGSAATGLRKHTPHLPTEAPPSRLAAPPQQVAASALAGGSICSHR
jgi:hypothetical protein